MSKVFISYSHRDDSEVLPIITELKSLGVDLWYDVSIDCGEFMFSDKIRKEIDRCEIFLCMLSQNALDSEWVKREYAYAIELMNKKSIKHIVPIYLHGSSRIPGIMFQFNSDNYVNIHNESQKKKFINNLQEWGAMDECFELTKKIEVLKKLSETISSDIFHFQSKLEGARYRWNRIMDRIAKLDKKRSEIKGIPCSKEYEASKINPSAEIFTIRGVSFSMIYIDGGTFQMGAQNTNSQLPNYDEEADTDELPIHTVTLDGFYLGETVVTQELWEVVMGQNPSAFIEKERPVENISWNDCYVFLAKINTITGRNFRLPTEAEWEFAAKGTDEMETYKFSGSNRIGSVAWYKDNSDNHTHPVKRKAPNAFGIYDMTGNVWEWCYDYKRLYDNSEQINPQTPYDSASIPVRRGGSWDTNRRRSRITFRNNNLGRDSRDNCTGLRLALSNVKQTRIH